MKNRHRILIIVVISYFFFVLGNSLIALTNPDEVFYVQTAKEMARHSSWMTPYLFDQPQFEKPVLTYWLLRIGFILFGASNFGARFFPAIFAGIGVIAVYCLGIMGFRDEKKAFLASLMLMSCVFYVGLARTVFTDMIFSVFIFLSLVSFFWGYSVLKRKAPGLMLFFMFAGLAVLTKGPLGLIIPVSIVIVFLAIRKDIKFLATKYSLLGCLIFLVVALPWYIFIIHRYGNDFIKEFFYNDHVRRLLYAEHKKADTWYFYPLTVIGCMFPWSLVIIASLMRLPGYFKKKAGSFVQFLACWIVTVFVIFQVAHSKLTSYILPVYPAVCLIAAGYVYDAVSRKKSARLLRGIAWGNVVLFLVIAIGLLFCRKHVAQYLTSEVPLYGLSAVFFVLAIAVAVALVKKKLLASFSMLSLLILLVLFMVPLAKEGIELQASSKTAGEYLRAHYPGTNTILCSKAFVRGIRFYTDKDVAVFDLNGKQFFSPHPIPFLSSPTQVQDFLKEQPLTYAILKKSACDEVARIIEGHGRSTLVEKVGNEYIVKIEYPAG